MAIMRSAYKGSSRKLVLAFDIGTTHSGVCYAFLEESGSYSRDQTHHNVLPLTFRADLTPDHLEQVLEQRLERLQNPIHIILRSRRNVLRCRGRRSMG